MVAKNIENIITIIAKSINFKEVVVTKLSDWLWHLKFYWEIDNQIFDYQYKIHEITLCDASPKAIADVICYEIQEINYIYRHKSIGDITCSFNARSPKLRCTINPSGPCEACRFYESNH